MYKKDQTIIAIKEEDKDQKEYLAKVEATMYKWPKGEPSYTWDTSKPLPQILVRLSDGSSQIYHGQEAVDQFIKETDKTFQEPKTLGEWFDLIKVDITGACIDLGEQKRGDGDIVKTLRQKCENLLPFLEPLMNSKCYYNGEMLYEFGEFDGETITFSAAIEGQALRNSGQKAFILSIKIHGYDISTFNLKVNETFWWH